MGWGLAGVQGVGRGGEGPGVGREWWGSRELVGRGWWVQGWWGSRGWLGSKGGWVGGSGV